MLPENCDEFLSTFDRPRRMFSPSRSTCSVFRERSRTRVEARCHREVRPEVGDGRNVIGSVSRFARLAERSLEPGEISSAVGYFSPAEQVFSRNAPSRLLDLWPRLKVISRLCRVLYTAVSGLYAGTAH